MAVLIGVLRTDERSLAVSDRLRGGSDTSVVGLSHDDAQEGSKIFTMLFTSQAL